MGSSPKAPKQTPAQQAFEIEQRRALNKEIIEENRRRKALARGQLGSVTLLSGMDATTGQMPTGGDASTSSALPSTSGSGVLDGGTTTATPAGVNKGTPRKIASGTR